VRRINIFKGAGFKSALYASIAFALTTLCLSIFVYHSIKNKLYGELQEQIKQDVVFLQETYRQGGKRALMDRIEGAQNQHLRIPKLLGAFEEQRKLGGNADVMPSFEGWKHVTKTVLSQDNNQYYALSTTVGTVKMVVGRPTGLITPALNTLLWLLGIASSLAIAVSLGIGYLASRRDSIKLKSIVDTLHAVSRGDNMARISVSDNDEQLNQVSLQINGNLDRLSSLMENTKNAATAIAHDLRTPINRASMMLQEARQTVSKRPDDSGLYIERAEQELENVSDIFDTILRISRISLSEDSKGFAKFSLHALAEDIVQTYQPVAEERSMQLTFDANSTEETTLDGDEDMLRQALVNLIENAITYCSDNAAITVALNTDDSQNLILEVRDNGPGLPEDALLKVLEPFYRETTSRNPPGNGLGLALVQAVANRHLATLQLRNLNPGLSCSLTFKHA